MMRREVHTARIEKFSHDGRGLARVDGKVTFIEGALPGETVTFNVTKQKRDFNEGRLLEVLVASTERVSPRCVHFGVCGGCSLQHLNEHSQIHVKQLELIDLLARVGHVTPEKILAPLTSSSWHYRNKARLSVRHVPKTKTVLVGYREKHDPSCIVDVKTCSVLNESIPIAALQSLVLSFDDPRMIPQIEVAVGDDEAALIIRHMSALSSADESNLREFSEQFKIKIYLQPKGVDSVHLFYPPSSDDFLVYRLPEHGITFQFHPTDFTQVNAGLNQKMVTLSLELLALNDEDIVLDLFCGLGNFTLPIAKHCRAVIGVEGTATMVKRAQMNAERNGLNNTTFLARNLDDSAVMNDLKRFGANKLLIDPPRTGAYSFVKEIHTLALERLVYVSCNPATLARDLGYLVHEQGYHLSAVGVMDMFPHTAHVESIALLEKK